MKINFRNKIRILRFGLLNEFSIDDFDMALVYKKFSKIITYPRTSKFVSFFGNNYLTLVIILMLNLCSIFFWPFYFLFQFLFKKKTITIYKNVSNSNNSIAILTDKDLVNKNYKILNQAGFAILISENDLSLFNNFKLIKEQPIIFSNLWVLIETICLNFYFIVLDNKFKFKMYPQLYILYSYNLYINILNKIIYEIELNDTPSLIYTSHYDRWAVLFDFIGKKNILVQHGILNNSFVSFYKQMNVSKVYLLDKKSGDIFKNNHIKSIFDFELVNYRLPIIKSFDDFTVLFISRPADFEIEKKILNELIQLKYKIKFIFKPHPSYDYGVYYNLKKNFDDNLIIFENNSHYPFANIIISGNSTLAFEYTNNGFNVISIETPIEILKNIIILTYEEFKVCI